MEFRSSRRACGPHRAAIVARSTRPDGQERAESRDDGDVRDVSISDDVIRLGQFLKLAGLIDSGADAKMLLGTGEIQVNGETEMRRGRQLHRGDVVSVDGSDDDAVRVA
jgi:ribosome-associated protein